MGEPLITLVSEQIGEEIDVDLYPVVLILFSLVFSIYLLYYHLDPPPELHAIRRSVTASLLFIYTHFFLSIALLVFSVSIKRCTRRLQVPMDSVTAWLLCGGYSTTLICLIIIRNTHYWSKRVTGVSVEVRFIWGVLMWAAASMPLILLTFHSSISTFNLLLILAIFMVLVNLGETYISHRLESQYSHSYLHHLYGQSPEI